MGLVRTTSIAVGFSLLLSACNTTDALTPPAAIGDHSSNFSSSPVTQRDVEQMAAAPPPQQSFGSAQQAGGYSQGYDGQGGETRSYRTGPGSPPSTLEAQADALRSGSANPEASKPIEDGQTEAPAGDADMQASEQAEQREADSRLSEQPQQQASLPSAASGDNTIRFLPIIGAPVQAVTPLSRQLGAEARTRGLTIKSSSDTSSSYILKGYLSAFQDGPAITVTYVWDVLDNSGARLHRIQGNESVPLKAGDPWTAVPASVMQRIASKTMAEFTSWRETRGG